jgi:septal ring factor EnvC (AmiA/AmiB activator)
VARASWFVRINSSHKVNVLQERDGFKSQVETLRDKVSVLSREVAENQDSSVTQGSRITSLENSLRKAEEDLASHKNKLAQAEQALQESRTKSTELEKRLQGELQDAGDAHARATKSWLSEKQLLCQACVNRTTCTQIAILISAGISASSCLLDSAGRTIFLGMFASCYSTVLVVVICKKFLPPRSFVMLL